MKSKISAISAATAALLLVPAGGAYAETSAPTVSEDEFSEQVMEYADDNPADVEGLKELAISLGGKVKSSSSTLYTDEVPELSDESVTDEDVSGAIVPMAGNFPSNVFTVNITVSSVGDTKIVTGSFNWRDDFAGQAAPFDVAALRFSDGCGGITNLMSSTYNVSGQRTDRTTLRNAGTSTNAPVWNVDAVTSGFANQADRGSFSAQFDTGACGSKTVRAAFDYEGNQGGALTSVSAGWGGLSVSYSNPGLILKKSTQPVTLN